MAYLTVEQACEAEIGSKIDVLAYVMMRGGLHIYPESDNFTVCRAVLCGDTAKLIEVRETRKAEISREFMTTLFCSRRPNSPGMLLNTTARTWCLAQLWCCQSAWLRQLSRCTTPRS